MTTAVSTPQFSTDWVTGTRRRRLVAVSTLAVGLCLGLARLILSIDVAAVAAFAALTALVAVSTRPRYGLYLLFAIVLFFDGVSVDPFMVAGHYINFSLQTTLNVSGAILIPFEMLVLLTSAAWLGQAAMRRKLDFRGGRFGRPMLLFGLVLAFSLVRGLASGGTFNTAFWESRFLFGMLLAYVLAANTIRTRKHVRILTGLIFVCVTLSALEGIWRKLVLIDAGLLGDAQELWYSHEDVVVWGVLVMLVLAQQVFHSGPRWQRFAGPGVALIAAAAMLVSERRAGLIAVMIAFALFTFALVTIKRKAFLLIALPAALVAAVYLPVFWNNPGTLGQAARAIRSISSPDPRDAASNAWRDLEAINVRATIASDPLVGIGFGRPFLQVVTVPDISQFEFWNYEAHHNILWVWMKTGALGFIMFFVLALGGIARSISLAKTLQDPELKTFAMVGMCTIVMSLVFCYVDLGLSSTRIPMLLGISLGTVGILDRIRA